jgi:hypothetical protein
MCMHVVESFSNAAPSLSPRLPFSGSEDSYCRLEDNPREQKFVITVRRLHSTNAILPHVGKGTEEKEPCFCVSQALKGEKRSFFHWVFRL